jgi:hypothetical protein
MVQSAREALGSLGLKIPLLTAAMAKSTIEAVEFTITDACNIIQLYEVSNVAGVGDGELNSLNAGLGHGFGEHWDFRP